MLVILEKYLELYLLVTSQLYKTTIEQEYKELNIVLDKYKEILNCDIKVKKELEKSDIRFDFAKYFDCRIVESLICVSKLLNIHTKKLEKKIINSFPKFEPDNNPKSFDTSVILEKIEDIKNKKSKKNNIKKIKTKNNNKKTGKLSFHNKYFSSLKIDFNSLSSKIRSISEDIDDLNYQISNLLGFDLNVRSYKQVDYCLKVVKCTSKAKKYLVSLIDSLKSLYSRKSYLVTLFSCLDKDDKVKPIFKYLYTGRVSTSKPNIQSMPRDFKPLIIADSGFKLVGFDYSQIEFKVLAHLSQDLTLLKLFNERYDIHTNTATNLSTDRRTAKMVNYSILYGMTSYKLSQELNISKEKAQNYINQFFYTYYEVLEFLKKSHKDAKNNLFVETITGRKIEVSKDIIYGDFKEQAQARRSSFNAIIQGSVADIVNIATKNILKYRETLEDKDEIRILLNLHDELIFEIKDNENFIVNKLVIKLLMENSKKLDIKLNVDEKDIDLYTKEEFLKAEKIVDKILNVKDKNNEKTIIKSENSHCKVEKNNKKEPIKIENIPEEIKQEIIKKLNFVDVSVNYDEINKLDKELSDAFNQDLTTDEFNAIEERVIEETNSLYRENFIKLANNKKLLNNKICELKSIEKLYAQSLLENTNEKIKKLFDNIYAADRAGHFDYYKYLIKNFISKDILLSKKYNRLYCTIQKEKVLKEHQLEALKFATKDFYNEALEFFDKNKNEIRSFQHFLNLLSFSQKKSNSQLVNISFSNNETIIKLEEKIFSNRKNIISRKNISEILDENKENFSKIQRELGFNSQISLPLNARQENFLWKNNINPMKFTIFVNNNFNFAQTFSHFYNLAKLYQKNEFFLEEVIIKSKNDIKKQKN